MNSQRTAWGMSSRPPGADSALGRCAGEKTGQLIDALIELERDRLAWLERDAEFVRRCRSIDELQGIEWQSTRETRAAEEEAGHEHGDA